MNRITIIISSIALLFVAGFIYFQMQSSSKKDIPTVKVEKRSFDIDVKTVGELEAAKSTIIASSVRGDQGKIIYLVQDGVYVKPGDILIRMDPTPFEEKIQKLKSQIHEQEAQVVNQEQTLEWEKAQAAHENMAALFEIEAAMLELDKIVQGDGPMETAKLKGAMQKALMKYEELNSYAGELLSLENEGFLNPSEIKQAQKKLEEEKEAYEASKMQYESYITHVYPMQIKKAEMSLKKAESKKDDVAKTGKYKVTRAEALLEQALANLKYYKNQLREEERELQLTEIKAPSPGMVVHREDYRSGQRRKPRVGDVLVKNQPLLDLPDLEKMIVKTKVREVDLYKAAIGIKATIQVDAYPQLSFSGTVDSIGVLALSDMTRTSEEKYFEVRVALDHSDERLRPGMTSRVTMHAQHIENVLAIPLHAIFDEKKKNFCYIAKKFNFERKEIGVGACNDQWAEVTSGLHEGDTVCLLNPFAEEEDS